MSVSKQPTGPFHPAYGCVVISIVVAVICFIIGWTIYTGLTQDKAIAAFAVSEPVKLAPALPDGAGLESLKARIATFGEALTAKQEASLTLNIAELNALLALAPDLGAGKFDQLIAFTGTQGSDELTAEVCFELNKLPFGEPGKRYAAGQGTFRVEAMADRGPEMKLSGLTIPGKSIAPEFVEAFGGWHWLTQFHNDAKFGPLLKRITGLKVVPTGIELHAKP
jgi:hypothetical protein